MSNNPSIQICLSPDLFHLFSDRKSIVVVVDVLRATSSMCLAIENGIEQIIPVSTVEEALEYKNGDDYILAAERNGQLVKGFDFGNSPQQYLQPEFLKGKTLVMTTTNGTKMINIAKNDHRVVIGSFLNITALTNWLKGLNEDVIICCSGWKGRFCLEDTLFAGALASRLMAEGFESDCDSVLASGRLYNASKNNLYLALEDSSHRKRLANLDIDKDVKLCLEHDLSDHIPILKENYLVSHREVVMSK